MALSLTMVCICVSPGHRLVERAIVLLLTDFPRLIVPHGDSAAPLLHHQVAAHVHAGHGQYMEIVLLFP